MTSPWPAFQTSLFWLAAAGGCIYLIETEFTGPNFLGLRALFGVFATVFILLALSYFGPGLARVYYRKKARRVIDEITTHVMQGDTKAAEEAILKFGEYLKNSVPGEYDHANLKQYFITHAGDLVTQFPDEFKELPGPIPTHMRSRTMPFYLRW